MAEVQSVSGADFEEVVLGAPMPVLVDFWAPWCAPCRMQSPILDQLADECGDALRVVKVNVDDAPDLSERFGIISVPSLHVYRSGELVKEIAGARPKQVLLKEIEPHL